MFKRFWKSPVQYRALGDIYADEKPNSTAIDSSTPELALPYRPTFWMVLASILAFTCAVLSTALVYTVQTKSQWRAIDSRLTDFEPALAVDEPVRVRFSGTATFDEHGTAHRDFDSSVVQYVGSPSPQIDQAWEGLIAGRYFSITDDEAQQAWGDSYHQYHKAPVAGYMAGLDVFHTLHCVNMMRKALDPEYYFADGSISEAFKRYHVDHCIDILRQSVQCHADLTPIPIRWFESAHRTFIDSDQVHTCRNFDEIRRWNTERYNGSLAVWKQVYTGEF